MSPTILDERPKQPSILTVYQPIEEYWGLHGPVHSLGPDPEPVLGAFDAYLVHLLLALCPDPPTLIDLAAGATAGASSLIGLTHPRVRRVLAVSSEDEAEPDQALRGLRAYLRFRTVGPESFEVLPASALRASVADRGPVVILADAGVMAVEELPALISSWLDALPDALVLLLGLGPVGDSPTIDALLPYCRSNSACRLWLIREVAEALAASRLGMVARREHALAREVLSRLELQYEGNFAFVDLLRQVNEDAMRAANLDDEILRLHPSAGPLRDRVEARQRGAHELETLRRLAQESQDQADAARAALGLLKAERDELRWVESTPFVTLIRRKLAPGILGKIYRKSKRGLRTLTRGRGNLGA
jgi:hypothetical protein